LEKFDWAESTPAERWTWMSFNRYSLTDGNPASNNAINYDQLDWYGLTVIDNPGERKSCT
jgi:hypothetical protein